MEQLMKVLHSFLLLHKVINLRAKLMNELKPLIFCHNMITRNCIQQMIEIGYDKELRKEDRNSIEMIDKEEIGWRKESE